MSDTNDLRTFEARFFAGQKVYMLSANHILETFISNVEIRSSAKESEFGGSCPSVTNFEYSTRYNGRTNVKYIFESIEEAIEYLKENIIEHADEVDK